MSAAIQPTTLPYGGRPARAMRIICGYCGAQYGIHVNTFRQHDDGELEAKWASRKFALEGWKIGRTEAQNRCPQCYMGIKAAAIRKRELAARTPGQQAAPTKEAKMDKEILMRAGEKMKEQLMSSTAKPALVQVQAPAANGATPPAAASPHAVPPRQMQREDRRQIVSLLGEVYDKKGYSGDWSDAKVAIKLDVPRAWVVHLRAENFGDESGNEELRALIGEARKLIEDVQQLRAQCGRDASALRMGVEHLERMEQKFAAAIEKAGK